MRNWLQLLFLALSNGYFMGFSKGTIYQGKSKQLCVPGLNCYSCPSALGACPLGALQASLTTGTKSFPYYAVGFLILFGVLFGRAVCGFLCPFGFVQDLLFKIPVKKVKKKVLFPKLQGKLPFLVLLLFVVGIPLFVTNQFGISSPAFCKWICPSGTLFGGIPLLLLDEGLRFGVGHLFYWKCSLLLLFLLWSIVEYRPFCKYLCPLGWIYGLFSSLSLYKMEYKKELCIGCQKCEKVCNMGVDVTKSPQDSRCIRCGDCVNACPVSALKTKFTLQEEENENLTIP